MTKTRIFIFAVILFCGLLVYRQYLQPQGKKVTAAGFNDTWNQTELPTQSQPSYVPVLSPVSKLNKQITSIEFIGPWNQIDLLIDGQSIYKPVSSPISEWNAQAESEIARAAFVFMKENFIVWNSPLKARFNKAYLYGFGYGLCGRESTLLTKIWHDLGLESQSIHWPHHVMAQVQLDGNYCLFDAQHHLDFEAILGKTVDIGSFQNGDQKLPLGFDELGYSYEYLNTFYSNPEFDLKAPKKHISPPLLSLSSDQKMVLRKRPSHADFPIPLSAQFNTGHRSHLIPNYELEVTFYPKAGEEVFLKIDLPFLGMKGPHGVIFKHCSVYNKDLDQASIEDINAAFFGIEGPIQLKIDSKMQPGEKLSASFLMAGWLGDRFFSSLHKKGVLRLGSEKVGTMDFKTVLDGGRVWVENIQLQDKPAIGQRATVKVTLAWNNLTSDMPLNYTIFLDALMSKLPFEVWQYISTWKWTFEPGIHDPSGSTVFEAEWKVTRRSGKYRPSQYRTLLAHVKGPKIYSGQPGFLLDFVCTEN